jgi:hypothetical protein
MTQTFACSVVANCATDNLTILGGNTFVLRPDQAKGLHLGTKAVRISPTTTLDRPVNDSVGATYTACTSTATVSVGSTPAEPRSQTFSSAQLIGATLGIGLPLLLGLLGALFVVWKQRKSHQALKSRYEQSESSVHSGRPKTFTIPESSSQEISEMDSLRGRAEMNGVRSYELQAGQMTPRPL